MKPVKHDIHIYQGTSWHLKTTFKDPDGNAIDLSVYDGDMQIRRDVAAADPLLTIDSDTNGGIALTADATHNLTATITTTQTEALPTNEQDIEDWVYDLRIWETADPENTTIRLIQGRVFVSPSVTRD